MSDILNTYTFLPWLRTGLANSVNATDQDTSVKERAEIEVPLKIEGAGVNGGATLTQTVNRKIQLYGPGDITGINSNNIIKTEPLNWITNFEPNYLAYIDFYAEDFPWRYTPAAPDTAKDRLQPWIALIVLNEDEFKDGKNIKDKPLPFIQIEGDLAAVFPPFAELWAWSHVHVNESLMNKIEAEESDKTAVINKFKQEFKKNPDIAYSRIMCPRKLAPNKSYHAFLVPVFETGRLAGLGLDPSESPFATFHGWGAYSSGTKNAPSDYPYYHRWYFKTGDVGDFEYLVRLLEPRPMDSRVGTRDMDVQDPGYNVDGITDPDLEGILKLGGALKIPYDTLSDKDKTIVDKYDGWDSDYPHAFQTDLANFVNLSDEYTQKNAEDANNDSNLDSINGDPDPLITPPIYGKWHALQSRLLKERDGSSVSQPQNWLHNLNLDPRFRVAAGFGTHVVQENQENYMKSAWKQIGEVLEANHQLRLTQLALAATKIWYAKHIDPVTKANPEKMFALSAPLQARVVTNGLTVKGHIERSVAPPEIVSSTMRRVTRPKGRLSKKLPFNNTITPFNLIDRINKKEVVPVKPKTKPSDLPTYDDVAEDTKPTGFNLKLAEWLLKNGWMQWVLIALAIIILILIFVFKVGVLSSGIGGAIALGILATVWYLLKQKRQLQISEMSGESSLDPEKVDDLPTVRNFKITEVGKVFRPIRGLGDNKEAKNFKTGLKDSFTLINASEKASFQEPKVQISITGMVEATFTAIDPAVTIPRLINNKIFIPGFILNNLFEQFTEAMVYPEFDTPMYKPLVNISSELFLPNINFVPQNSISLLETNQEFIESYMVGLNHEFSRELLWREYPTDQRGSYFRQFWDVSSFYNDDTGLSEEELKEKLRDIPPLHKWSKFSKLGDHDNREEGGDKEEELVLVIRGELLKKYPNAVIYAHKAKWQMKDGEIDNKVERQLIELSSTEQENPPRNKVKTPLYEAQVIPDIYFFGFDLTATEAKGGSGESGDEEAGWFFVIKERPGEPRFGLDIGTENNLDVWNDLSWGKVMPDGADESFLQIQGSPSLTLTEPNPTDESEKIDQHNEDVNVHWSSNMNSAEMAYILFQSPVMVAVHASEMLPK